jgi:hypothetical protein
VPFPMVLERCEPSRGAFKEAVAYVGRDGSLVDKVFLQSLLINHVAICCTENKARIVYRSRTVKFHLLVDGELVIYVIGLRKKDAPKKSKCTIDHYEARNNFRPMLITLLGEKQKW